MKALADLIEGFVRFRGARVADPAFRRLVDEGQTPRFLVIACSDSRVDPALLFDSRPGDFFVVRNVANLIPLPEPDFGRHGISAAIEFAVTSLRVRHAVVCGHSDCGGVRALVEGKHRNTETYIGRWIMLGEDALAEARAIHKNHADPEIVRTTALHNVAHGVRRLRKFPFVAQAIERGDLYVHGLFLDLAGPSLLRLRSDNTWGPAEDLRDDDDPPGL